jgi:phosphoribosyl-AMP cyclohydrolase
MGFLPGTAPMSDTATDDDFLAAVNWNNDGLVPAIAQDYQTGEVLMMAWMNRESLAQTVARSEAVYWSRSRKQLWAKGESSGHVQRVHTIRLDCDADTLVLAVEQVGGIACHTGRRSCFFRELRDGDWQVMADIIKDPAEIYR